MAQNNSFMKSALKTGLDTTRYTSCQGTFLSNISAFNQGQGCKINQAYKKAVSLIDQLVAEMKQKKQISRMGVKNVGDTNQYVLDLWKQYQMQQKLNLSKDIPYEKQQVSQVDLEKLQLLKVIETQRQQNQSLHRKCNHLQTQNSKLKESNASALGQKAQNRPPNYYQPVNYDLPPVTMMSTRIFCQLQNLKAENQLLRQETIKLLQTPKY